jgi:hypothetical protein
MQHSLWLVALYGIMEYFKNLFEALHRLRFTFIVNVLEHGFKLLLVIVLFHGGEQFTAIITAYTIAVGIALTGGLVAALRVIPRIFTSFAPRGLMQAYLIV